ncbi:MAG: hypothetical protein IMF16_07030 [Proteobacteria bacterium]|nr:hypothetical protein [Pseudomonadota bacterium]
MKGRSESGGTAGKIVSVEEAKVRAGAWREGGKTVAYTNGCFDLLHAGHVRMLEAAQSAAPARSRGMRSNGATSSWATRSAMRDGRMTGCCACSAESWGAMRSGRSMRSWPSRGRWAGCARRCCIILTGRWTITGGSCAGTRTGTRWRRESAERGCRRCT